MVVFMFGVLLKKNDMTYRDFLEGHQDEIFSCAFNYDGKTIITSSKDNTCKIWKAKND